MKPQYKTGDVTFVHGTFRIYVNEESVKGYFHYTKDNPVFIHHKNKVDTWYMEKVSDEKVICTIDDIMKALVETYGKEVR